MTAPAACPRARTRAQHERVGRTSRQIGYVRDGTTVPGVSADASPPPRLPARVRIGYGSGSVATGAFGTVPGLMLLPYLTDSLGIAALAAGLIVLLPKAWDVVLNPIAGRISDRTVDPRGPAPAMAAAGRPAAGGGVRADLRGPGDGVPGAGSRVGAGVLPGRRVGVRVLPGAVRRDARRDHVVVRRAHPADDLAGGDPRVHDHAGGRDRARDPRRGRWAGGVPRDGRGDGRDHRGRRRRRLPRHASGTGRSGRARRRHAARPAADRGGGARLPAVADDVRRAGAGDRVHARRGRLPRRGRARPVGCDHDPLRLLRRAGARADARVGGAGRADRQAHRLLPGVGRARARGPGRR